MIYWSTHGDDINYFKVFIASVAAVSPSAAGELKQSRAAIYLHYHFKIKHLGLELRSGFCNGSVLVSLSNKWSKMNLAVHPVDSPRTVQSASRDKIIRPREPDCIVPFVKCTAIDFPGTKLLAVAFLLMRGQGMGRSQAQGQHAESMNQAN